MKIALNLAKDFPGCAEVPGCMLSKTKFSLGVPPPSGSPLDYDKESLKMMYNFLREFQEIENCHKKFKLRRTCFSKLGHKNNL